MITESHGVLAAVVGTEVFDRSLSFSWKNTKIKILKCSMPHRTHIKLLWIIPPATHTPCHLPNTAVDWGTRVCYQPIFPGNVATCCSCFEPFLTFWNHSEELRVPRDHSEVREVFFSVHFTLCYDRKSNLFCFLSRLACCLFSYMTVIPESTHPNSVYPTLVFLQHLKVEPLVFCLHSPGWKQPWGRKMAQLVKGWLCKPETWV